MTTNHIRLNSVGRPRAHKNWESRQLFRMTLNYRESPSVHTFLYENQTNPQFREIVMMALEEYFENHDLPYLDLDYCEQVRRAAFDENSLIGQETQKSVPYTVPRVKKKDLASPSVETADISPAMDTQLMFAQIQAQMLEQQKMMQQQLEEQRIEAEKSRLAMEKQLQESLQKTANAEAALQQAVQQAAITQTPAPIVQPVEIVSAPSMTAPVEKPNAEVLSIAETLGEL